MGGADPQTGKATPSFQRVIRTFWRAPGVARSANLPQVLGMTMSGVPFLPLILRTAMDPWLSISQPEEVVFHCARARFAGVGIVETSRFMAASRAKQAGREVAAGTVPRGGAGKNMGTKPFPVLLGLEARLVEGNLEIPLILYARTGRGWGFLLALATRRLTAIGPVQVSAQVLTTLGSDVVVLIRNGTEMLLRAFPKKITVACPHLYLALESPDPGCERAWDQIGVKGVAAPELAALRTRDLAPLNLWRTLHDLSPLDREEGKGSPFPG